MVRRPVQLCSIAPLLRRRLRHPSNRNGRLRVRRTDRNGACCFSINHDVDTVCASDFLNGLTDQTVECAEDLPLTCAPEAEALNVCDQTDIFCSVNAFTELGISTHT